MFVKLWMKTDVISISTEQSLREAEEIMVTHKIRRLPVIKEEKLVGILSQEDIKRALPSVLNGTIGDDSWDSAAQAKVSSLMTANPITASPLDPIEDVAVTMRKNKVGGIPVCHDGELVGIITESDIFQAFAEVLGAGNIDDTRIELKINHDSEAVYEIIDLCQEHDMRLNAISTYKDYSHEHQLLTLRVKGEQLDQFIDELWNLDCQINRIIPLREE